jgi:hypothetical protein
METSPSYKAINDLLDQQYDLKKQLRSVQKSESKLPERHRLSGFSNYSLIGKNLQLQIDMNKKEVEKLRKPFSFIH